MIILFHFWLMWVTDTSNTNGKSWLITKGNNLFKEESLLIENGGECAGTPLAWTSKHIRGQGKHGPGRSSTTSATGDGRWWQGPAVPVSLSGGQAVVCEAGTQARTRSGQMFSATDAGRDVHRQHWLLPLGFRSTFWILLANRAFWGNHRPEIIGFLFTFEKQFVACWWKCACKHTAQESSNMSGYFGALLVQKRLNK